MKEYEVTIDGIEHTLQLSAEDAKKYESAKEVKSADAPSNKSRTPSNK